MEEVANWICQANWFVLLLICPREEKRKGGNLHLLSGEQHVRPLVDLPDERLCFSHTVVALPLPLQMLHLHEIQLGSKEGTETPETQREKQIQGETTGGGKQEERGVGMEGAIETNKGGSYKKRECEWKQVYKER